MSKRVFICGLVQESNSFNPVLTDFEDFSTSGIYDGQALLDSDGRAGETLNGMICAARQRGLELVGGRRMRSKSGSSPTAALRTRCSCGTGWKTCACCGARSPLPSGSNWACGSWRASGRTGC